MVSRIQKDTSMAVEAISQIAELNAHLKDISGSIASAVEEQSIVTRETTNSLGDIAQRNRSMVAKMESIVEAVGKTKSSCEKLDSMALFQSRTASELEAVVGKGDGDFIKWSDEYSVSVPSIDEQHKVLFRLVNQLFSGVKAMDQEVIHEVLDELVNYTVNHFKFEEQIFSKIHYSHEADHKDHHKALVTQVGSFVKEFKSGQGMVDFRLLNFLRSWLKGHILIEDMKYKDEMIRAGIR
jgi:methyl-accepting chemotaxis protein/hemerythrin